jgi:hypothetical protein
MHDGIRFGLPLAMAFGSGVSIMRASPRSES